MAYEMVQVIGHNVAFKNHIAWSRYNADISSLEESKQEEKPFPKYTVPICQSLLLDSSEYILPPPTNPF